MGDLSVSEQSSEQRIETFQTLVLYPFFIWRFWFVN